MRNRLFLLVALTIVFSTRSLAQIVGTDVFLQGHWLEVGVDQMGAFGTCSSPATYHVHPSCYCSTTCSTSGSAMDASYDWGHDGWATGAPCLMGPYTQPGYPQEGWGIQVGATEYRNWAGGGLCSGSFAIPGSITGYTNTGGSATGTFTGAIAGLNIIQDTRVDTNASWVVVTCRFYNTSATASAAVWYERTCDPDNSSDWGGGSTTTNVIVHQNEDPQHDVYVGTYSTATSGSLVFNQYNSWMGLATKDCRAKCGVLPSLYPTTTPSNLWTGSGTTVTAFSDSNSADEGIFLIFNIGSIPGNDSAVVSYAYIYNGRTGNDSALPDPELVVNGTPIPTALPPTPTIDTFNTCSVPGMTTLPVSIINGTDRDWTWSKWTWSPSTGLASTTGVNNSIDVTVLPGPTTYTITGTDTSSGTMLDCNVRVYLLTVMPCHKAHVNSPCIGNALFFGMTGDSTGATYLWTGPGGYTSALHDPIISPSTWADTGLYHVIKTIAGVSDTDSVYVVIHPTPTIMASSNAPLCVGMVDTLRLSAAPDSVGETFSWSGPDGFTSTLMSPSVNGFGFANVGIYVVTGTTIWGCKDSSSVDAINVPPPPAPIISGLPNYCYGAAYTPPTAFGADVLYYTSPTATGTSMPTTVDMTPSTIETTTIYATQQLGSCLSAMDSFTITVYPQILPFATVTYNFGCTGDTVTFDNSSSLNSDSYTWSFGDATPDITDSTSAWVTHQHIYRTRDTFTAVLTSHNPVCDSALPIQIDTRHDVVANFAAMPDTICLGVYDTVFFNNYSWTTIQGSAAASPGSIVRPLAWDFGDGVTDTVWQPYHVYASSGTFHASVTVTDSIGCTSSYTEPVFVMQLYVNSFSDTTLCLGLPLPLINTWSENPVLGIVPSFSWTQSTPNLSSTTIDTPLLSGFGTFYDTLTIKLPGVPGFDPGCPVSTSMIINSRSANPVTALTASATISYGSSIQLNADNELRYYWTPDNGTLSNPNINDPVATPSVTTTYTVYGYDIYGCLATANVTIYVDSSDPGGVPTAFTPNNDGLNDIFRLPPPPRGSRYDRLVEFRVFNRWGELVFNTNDRTAGWDGTYHGVPQDIGVYFYEIIVGTPGGANVSYSGTVTLIR